MIEIVTIDRKAKNITTIINGQNFNHVSLYWKFGIFSYVLIFINHYSLVISNYNYHYGINTIKHFYFDMTSLMMPCCCPGLTCFACYVRAVFRAIVLLPNPDEQSITDYIMNGHTSAKRPIIKTVINFLLINHMLECKSEYIIFGNDDADTRAADNYSNENRVALEEHSPDITEAASTGTSSSVRNDSPRHVNDNRHVVARSNFVCDVCNRPCLSAAGLVSHRRVHRS